MIQTDNTHGKSLKAIREKEKKEKEAALKELCNALAYEKLDEQKIIKWSNANQGLWYLPILDDDGNIETMLILKPITRHVLGYATTKITEEGLYAFLEVGMRECFVASIEPDGSVVEDAGKGVKIIDDDEYFLPAADKFNNIIQGKKAALVKR